MVETATAALERPLPVMRRTHPVQADRDRKSMVAQKGRVVRCHQRALLVVMEKETLLAAGCSIPGHV